MGRPAPPGLAAGHPAGVGHGAQPHGRRLALGDRAPRVVHLAARAPVPRLPRSAARTWASTTASRSASRTTTGTTRTPPSSSSARDRGSGERRYIYHGNDGTSFPWNDTAQLDFSQAGRPGAGDPDDPRGRPALPGHPLRRRDGAGQAPRPPAVVPGPGRGWRVHPVACRARLDDRGGVRRRHARRVLARGRGPGRRGGAGHPAPGRGVLDARGLLRAHARHAPRLQQRVHAHAPRRGQRQVPAGPARTPWSSTRRSSSATSTS